LPLQIPAGEAALHDKILIALVVVAGVLSLGHFVDHFVRGDVPWPLTAESVPFLLVMAIVYTIAGGGLYLYWINRVGPGFWAITGVLAAAFAWFGHFSPFTDQPPQHILHAYTSPPAGWLAVGCLVALALTLVVMAIYAGYLWLGQGRVTASRSR
jgi:hypothetical protein